MQVTLLLGSHYSLKQATHDPRGVEAWCEVKSDSDLQSSETSFRAKSLVQCHGLALAFAWEQYLHNTMLEVCHDTLKVDLHRGMLHSLDDVTGF